MALSNNTSKSKLEDAYKKFTSHKICVEDQDLFFWMLLIDSFRLVWLSYCRALYNKVMAVFVCFNPLQLYSDVIIVDEITKISVETQLINRCGKEGANERSYREGIIDEEEYKEIEVTKKILTAANSFIPDAEEDGADLTNAAFILSQPWRSFVIQAGNGEWEYIFEREYDGNIYGRCVRKPFLRHFCNNATNIVARVFSVAGPVLNLVFFRRRALPY